MGLPSRTMWATRNIDVSQPGNFAESPLQYGCSYFSWANVDGHNTVEGVSFGEYSFGTGNNTEPYVSSPGHNVEGQLDNLHDAARVLCGSPWSIPSREQFIELLNPSYTEYIDEDGIVIDDSVTNKVVTLDGVNCIRLRSKRTGQILNFPLCGYARESQVLQQSEIGEYWASVSPNLTSATILYITSQSVSTNAQDRYRGLALRPCFNLLH